MLARIGVHQQQPERDGTTTEPLLGNTDGHDSDPDVDEPIIFAVNDEDDLEDSSALGDTDSPTHKSGHSVRFQDYVQVIGPPLRSTIQSREAGA